MPTPPGPPKYRDVDCNVWAKNKIKALKKKDKNATPQKVYIKPIGDAVAISGIKVGGSDDFVYPNPPWGDHYAVRNNGLYMDEQFPSGLSEDDFKARFEYIDQLSFTDVADEHSS